jgi:uncharacterized membrane protein YdbT with pleckstrin-like domain
MGYVENNLMPSEEVLYRGSVHWAIYVPGLLVLGLGAALYQTASQGLDRTLVSFVYLGAGLFALLGFIMLGRATVTKATTELALTSRRIVSRTGLIWREILDMNYNKIESVQVDQSLLGGMLGYGSLVVQGVGGSRARVRDIQQPQAFRMKAVEMIDGAQSGPQPK